MANTIQTAFARRLNSSLLEQLPIDQLRRYPNNPRKHSLRQIRKIAKSIGSFGILIPVLIDEKDVILAGQAVIEAAKHLGMSEVPVLRVEHLSERDKRAVRIALNRLAEDGEWDREHLGKELRFLVDTKFDIELTGFEAAEVDLILEEQNLSESEEPKPEDDALQPVEGKAPISAPGDLWLLGTHRLLVGDARDRGAYSSLMNGEAATVVFTDPPYNVRVRDIGSRGRTKHREFAMASGEMGQAEYARFLASCFDLMAIHSVDGAVHFICTDAKHLAEMSFASGSVYTEHLTLCIWDKMSGGMGGLYRNQHELIFVEKVGTGTIINNVQLGRFGRNRSNVWPYRGLASFGKDRLESLKLHPTVKPVRMVADAILDVSRRSDIVLDPFAGSGTTVIAAEKTGRRARVMEIDPLYADVIIRRWQGYAGKNAVHAASGSTFEEIEALRED